MHLVNIANQGSRKRKNKSECHFLVNTPELKDIQVTFTVTEHPFLSADRVFMRRDKKRRMIEVIRNPEKYISIYKKYGAVKILGRTTRCSTTA